MRLSNAARWSLAPLLLGLACAPAIEPGGELRSGSWRAWLDSPGGELPFGLELEQQAAGWQARLVNGQERIPVDSVRLENGLLTLSIEHYDSRIEASVGQEGRRLDGWWTKTSGPDGQQAELSFHAVEGRLPRFNLTAANGSPAAASTTAAVPISAGARTIDGRWSVSFADSEDPAVGIFETQDDGSVSGTFLTTTGDYRYLAGAFDGQRLLLSCFDGAHAFLFEAQLGGDDVLRGDFWSRDSWHEGWTAQRDDAAALPDAFLLTRALPDVSLDSLVFTDLEGKRRSLGDPTLHGRATILEVFGSWCPNCNDATAHMVELHERYGARGLSIVGVAFELTGRFDRDAAQLRTYAQHHGIEYPLLIAGTSDKAEASDAFPLLDRIRSYPTTIFLDGQGKVRAVYQGYTGPATGSAHIALRKQFDGLLEELLGESAPIG